MIGSKRMAKAVIRDEVMAKASQALSRLLALATGVAEIRGPYTFLYPRPWAEGEGAVPLEVRCAAEESNTARAGGAG